MFHAGLTNGARLHHKPKAHCTTSKEGMGNDFHSNCMEHLADKESYGVPKYKHPNQDNGGELWANRSRRLIKGKPSQTGYKLIEQNKPGS
jgi:hypothetical protein